MIRFVTAIAMVLGTQLHAEPIKLAVTTSFNNSGLSDILLPQIKDDTGLEVQLLVVGTGQALRLGEAGDVDAVLVHSRTAEEAFVAQGHATHRREVMYNDFVLIGPAHDPASVSAATTVTDAIRQIASAKAAFVSRGDESGTHKKERALWSASQLDPESFGPWYKSVGAGMGAGLNIASSLNAYILSDRASWLTHGNKQDLRILFSGVAQLFNQYSYLPVNPERHAHVNYAAALKLESWLTSDVAKELIDGYTLNGEELFVFNAQPR